jgi:predicted ATPase
MQVTITEDYRTLKKGTTYSFKPLTILVGENGCGKSSLLQAIRASLEPKNSNNCDLNYIDRKELADKVLIDTEYAKIVVFDTTMDRANSMNNGADAFTWIMAGGMATSKASNGQVAMHHAVAIIKEVETYKIKNPLNKILIILDELDTGFSPRYQRGFATFCNKLVSKSCDLIVVSHSSLFLEQQKEVLVFEDNKYTPPLEYLYKL